jgi:thiol:disulfide interchange protein
MSVRCACASCRCRSLLGPVLLVTLGVLWLVGRLGGVYSLHTLWPVLLIVIGAVKLGEALASREGHVGA